jgi:hypothetical protein
MGEYLLAAAFAMPAWLDARAPETAATAATANDPPAAPGSERP